jgi:transcriptional regulator with GAF, ATPase, and Fis domain
LPFLTVFTIYQFCVMPREEELNWIGPRGPVITSIDGRMRLHVPKTLQLPVEHEAPRDQDALHRPLPVEVDGATDDNTGGHSILTETERKSREMLNIESALRQCRGKVSGPGGAARMLDVKPTTLYSRIHRYGIDPRKFK